MGAVPTGKDHGNHRSSCYSQVRFGLVRCSANPQSPVFLSYYQSRSSCGCPCRGYVHGIFGSHAEWPRWGHCPSSAGLGLSWWPTPWLGLGCWGMWDTGRAGPRGSPFSPMVTTCPLCCSPPTCPSWVLTMLLLLPGAISGSAPRSSSSLAPSRGWWGALGCSGEPRAGLPAQGAPLGQHWSALGGLTPTPERFPQFFGVQRCAPSGAQRACWGEHG